LALGDRVTARHPVAKLLAAEHRQFQRVLRVILELVQVAPHRGHTQNRHVVVEVAQQRRDAAVARLVRPVNPCVV
jgi:hypothetical protein